MAFLGISPWRYTHERNRLRRSTCTLAAHFIVRPALNVRLAQAHFRASYSDDLATRTRDIAPSATDNLISSVRRNLDEGGPSSISPAQMQEMVVHLADTRGMARLGLVEAFGRIGSPAVDDLLTGLKFCPSPVVRRSCGKALAKIGDPRATGTLIETLIGDEDTVTRSSAAGALAKMGFHAVPKLLSVIASSDSSMTAKGHAAWAISFMQGEASNALFDYANDSNPDVRVAVIAALGAVAIGDALPVMGGGGIDDWIQEEDSVGEIDCMEVKERAAQRKKAVEYMMAALADPNLGVRAEAAMALANAGVYTAATHIAELFEQSDLEIRRSAAFALMKLRHTESVARLRRCAEDPNEEESLRSVARLAAQTISQSVDEPEW